MTDGAKGMKGAIEKAKELAETTENSFIPTGSAANLRLISQEYVDIAFVQSDVMKDAYNGTGYFDKEYKGYSLLPGYIQRRYKWQCRKIRI